MREQAPRSRTVGITLPNTIWRAIDKKRGDVPTSKYFQRLAERDLGLTPIMTVVNKGIGKMGAKEKSIKIGVRGHGTPNLSATPTTSEFNTKPPTAMGGLSA